MSTCVDSVLELHLHAQVCVFGFAKVRWLLTIHRVRRTDR